MTIKKSQKSLSVEGNSDSSTVTMRSRKYVFTLNNYEEDNISQISQYLGKYSKEYIFGKEVGEKTETPHLQGYIEFPNDKKFIEIKNQCEALGRAHFIKAKGTAKQNYDYCSKEGDFYTNIEIPRPLKIISDLFPWQNTLAEMLKNEPDDRSVIWIYDDLGNNGKSCFLKWCVMNLNCIFTTGGKGSDILNLCMNNKDKLLKNNCLVMWSCARETDYDHIRYGIIETIKDGIICNTKYEAHSFICNSPHVLILANEMPNMQKLTKDRWKIFTIENKELIPYNEMIT